MRLNLNFEAINNHKTVPFQEKNWCENINVLTEITEKNGFHFSIEHEDITIWNGKKRLYFPLMSLGLRFESIEDLKNKYESKKEWFINKYQFIFKELSLLGINDDDLAKIIMPYLIQIGFNDNNNVLYIEGDIEDGKLNNCSFSNYFSLDARNGFNRILFDYKEFNLDSKYEQAITEMIVQSKNLFNHNTIKYK